MFLTRCLLSQGTLAVLALHLARQIHFHASLGAGPQPAECYSWQSPLYRFLSSSWWRHPHSCEFSILKGQLGQAGSFSGSGSISGHTSGKEPSAITSLPFLSEVRGRGVWGSAVHTGCGPCLPLSSPQCPSITSKEEAPTPKLL